MRAGRLLLSLSLLAAAAALPACGDGGGPADPFTVRESVEQLHVTHAPPATELEVVDSVGARVAVGTTDAQGSFIFRKLPPGDGYVVRTTTAMPALVTGAHSVMTVAGSQPEQAFYTDQHLVPGYQYVTTRDGTTLSAYVTFPVGPPPYPTVVSYSGYDPSRPGEPLDESLSGLCDGLPVICDAPNDPSAMIAAFWGYATVNVNIRGTGCSGGAFDFFETMQLLDGYDVIETVAAQPWVMNGKVGMVGLSYPGITQLFVASTRPPHLAAIAPMSVIGAAHTTMLPGGILNDGFATNWISNVIEKAQPYGQGWERPLVDAGDTTCAENQLLHGQYVDNVEQARHTDYYVPAEHDRYNLATFVGDIDVPVFLAAAWEDEQTGPYFFTMLDKFTGSPAKRFNVYNGVHIDAYQPQVLGEWITFLELFVAQRVPVDKPVPRSLAPQLYQQVFGTSTLEVPESRFLGEPDLATAVNRWKAEPPLRALFESGAGNDTLGAPQPTFERSFTKWPPTETQPLRLYAQVDGSLGGSLPVAAAPAFTFDLDPEAGHRSILAPGGNVWDLLPAYAWPQPAAGSAVVFESAPLAQTQVMFGTASVDLWLRSPVDDADLEVNLTEIRPDGQEMYVQSGWLRASRRGSGPDATTLWPAPTFLQSDAAPLVPGEWTQVRVGTAGFQHVFRAGSRVRVSIDTPGGSRAEWFFALKQFPSAVTYEIGHDAAHPTSIALPVVAGVTAPSPLPPCPSLRGQQCRAYAPYVNSTRL
jgi:predicted acyl esterase